ncbi:hypothetical protein A8F94_06790 [Bacillus sp. FJAT-27225]|uniref:hypothetical protein n=1 Tax=Bacillus sp. FJAT-27225 TaxID=1743144 RepID=UPI00080C31BD|nr:hypothetical protein [Bacillus sp. FJAT-27225]OCA87560.1 hypothetical protein A8F94_06790 [Bacillus sp. FJAT-27225]
MKKFALTIFGAAILLGAGSAGALAEGPGKGTDLINFGEMKGHLQQMHPEMNEKELKDMYESCHDTGGAEPSKNFQMMDPNHF